ncbi:MAG TPA: hypothetical protein VL334_10660 [Anaerolineae bacterium]|nr:hypothetical protein [Anaerolineae bacterium]
MSSLQRSLRNHSPAMLRAIAEANGVALASNQAAQMVEQLAATLSDTGHLRASVAACTPAAQEALVSLLREGGRSPRPAFERAYGGVRPAGPGKLERERPHLAPANPTEELWYRGLLYPTMVETPDGLVEFLYVPGELAELLPPPPPTAAPFPPPALAAAPAAQPSADLLLHDACSLLCLVQAGLGMLNDPADLLSWQSKPLYEYSQISLQPPEDPAFIAGDGPGSLAGLALALAVEMGWLRARGRRLELAPAPVRLWLEASRAQQRRQLLDAWVQSTLWNDLCRTPELSCEQTGSWANDPAGTRQRLLPLLASLQPDAWYNLGGLAMAIKAHAPNFQRPDGNYDTWYIRQRGAPAFLRGFEHWEQVEGASLRFVLTGPLHWLRAIVLTAGDDAPANISLTPAGHAWLHGALAPFEPDPALLSVQADFTVHAPADAALLDRFRVARFTTWLGATWEDGQPAFAYRISQTGLRRAAQQGIDSARVLDFLQERAVAPLPANVVRALERRTTA